MDKRKTEWIVIYHLHDGVYKHAYRSARLAAEATREMLKQGATLADIYERERRRLTDE